MGDYSVPETIRAMKPRGTIVKRIKGHYYVYTCRNEKRDDGKWHLTTGKAIGSVREGIGFVPNDGYNSEGRASVLEYGRYAPALTSSLGELERLERHFNPLEATEIYVLALLFCADGYMPLKSVGEHYTQSYSRSGIRRCAWEPRRSPDCWIPSAGTASGRRRTSRNCWGRPRT